MQDTLRNIAVSTGVLTGIEATHNMPIDEPVKIGMQIVLGIVNLIFIIRQHRKNKSNGNI